ncbi:MAG: hypothetical protein C0600_02900, partial [Ignavibacteria bacterium]
MRAARLAHSEGMTGEEAEAHVHVARSLALQDRLVEALFHGNNAIQIARTGRDKKRQVFALGTVARIYMEKSENDSALAVLDEAEQVSRALEPSKTVLKVLQYLGQLHGTRGEYQKARHSHERQLTMAMALGDKKDIATAHSGMSKVLSREGKYIEAIYHARLDIDISEQRGDSLSLGIGLLNIADFYNEILKFDSFTVCIERARTIALNIGHYKLALAAGMNLAAQYVNQGNYTEGLELNARNLELAERSGGPWLIAVCQQNLGITYLRHEQYEQGLSLLNDALPSFVKAGNRERIASIYDAIGVMYYQRNMCDSATYYCSRGLSIRREIGDPATTQISLTNLGNAYRLCGENEMAVSRYTEAVSMSDSLNLLLQVGECYVGLGRIHQTWNKIQSALPYAEKALQTGLRSRNVEVIRDARLLLSELHHVLGNDEKAFRYHQAYTVLNDSLINEENLRTINQLSAKYEADKRERQITLLEKDRELKDLELAQQNEYLRARTLEALKRKQQIGLLEKDKEIQSLEILRHQADYARQTAVTEQRENEVRLLTKDKQLQASLLDRETFRRNAILGGLLALLIVTGLIFYRLRERKKANTRLSNTLSELRRTQDQLIHSEKMATLGELTAGIAHEIKNPLNFVTNFSTLSGEMVQELETQLSAAGSSKVSKAAEGSSTRDSSRDTSGSPEILSILDDLKANMGKIQEHGRRADGIVASMLLHARS